MPRAQNRTAKSSILKEDEILCPSGYIIYLCGCWSVVSLYHHLEDFELWPVDDTMATGVCVACDTMATGVCVACDTMATGVCVLVIPWLLESVWLVMNIGLFPPCSWSLTVQYNYLAKQKVAWIPVVFLSANQKLFRRPVHLFSANQKLYRRRTPFLKPIRSRLKDGHHSFSQSEAV